MAAPEQQSSGEKLADSIKKNESPDVIKNQISNIPEAERLAAVKYAEAKVHEGVPSSSLPHLTIEGETENSQGQAIPKKVIYEHERTDVLKDLPIVGGKTAKDEVYVDNPYGPGGFFGLEAAARAAKEAKKPLQEKVNEAVQNTYNPQSKQQ